MENEITIEQLVEAYNKMRDALDALDAEYKKKKTDILLQFEKVEEALFTFLRDNKLQSVKTAYGTVLQTTQSSVKVADWSYFLGHVVETAINEAYAEGVNPEDHGDEAFIKRVLESESWALLKRAASKDSVKAYIETEKKVVPGVDFSQRLQVSVRRK